MNLPPTGWRPIVRPDISLLRGTSASVPRAAAPPEPLDGYAPTPASQASPENGKVLRIVREGVERAVCRALGGLPLAIQFATMAPAEPQGARETLQKAVGEERLERTEKALARLDCPPAEHDGLTRAWADINTRCGGYFADSVLKVLEGAPAGVDGPQLMKGLQMLAAAKRPDILVHDTASVLEVAAKHPQVPLPEVFEVVGRFRALEPQTSVYNPRFCDIRKALETVLAAPDRSAACDRLLRFAVAGRNAAVAQGFDQRVESLGCTGEEREAIRADLAACLAATSSRYDSALLTLLDTLASRKNASAEYPVFQGLRDQKLPTEQAAEDCATIGRIADRFPTVPLDEIAKHALAFRKTDPRYPNPSVPDLTPLLEHVCSKPDRAAATDRILRLQKLRDGNQALALEKLIEAVPSVTLHADVEAFLPKAAPYSYEASLHAVLGALKGRSDGAELFAAFTQLAPVVAPPQAALDVKSIIKTVDTRSAKADDMAGHALALRQADPQTGRYRDQYCDLFPALDVIAKGPDPAKARARLLALAVLGRNSAEAVAIDRLIGAIKTSDADREKIRAGVLGLVNSLRASSLDGGLSDALKDIAARPDPAAEFEAFAHLKTVAAPDQAERDLRTLEKLADAHPALPWSEIAVDLAALRKADRSSSTDLGPSMEHALASPDRKIAIDALLELQALRSPDAALLHQKGLEGLVASAEERARIREDYKAVLHSCYSQRDPALLSMLDLLSGRPDGPAGYDVWRKLFDTTKSAETATEDLVAAAKASAAHGRSLAELGEDAVALRAVDPQRNAYNGRYGNLDAVLDDLAQGPDRRQALLALQVGGRDSSQALALEKRLRALPGTPEEKTAMRGVVAKLLSQVSPRDDSEVLAALDSLASRPQASAELAAFAALLSEGNAERAGRDLKALQAAVDAHPATPRAEILEHLQALRGAARSFPDSEAGPALERVLSAPDPLRMRERLVAFETARLSIDVALQFENRVAARSDDEDAVRAKTLELLGLQASSTDLGPLLEQIKSEPNRLAVLELCERLHQVTRGRFQVVWPDARCAVDAAERHKKPLSEVCASAAALRAADPGRSSYGRPESLKELLDHVLHNPSSERATERLCALLPARGFHESIELDKRLLAACPELEDQETFKGFQALLAARNQGDDDLLEIAQRLHGRASAREEAATLGTLLGAGRSVATVGRDLALLQHEADARPTAPRSTLLDKIVALRSAEGATGTDLSASLEAALDTPDPAQAKALVSLLEIEHDGPSAAEDLRWILDDPAAKADRSKISEEIPSFEDRVSRFIELRHHGRAEDRAGVKYIYERILADGLVEHQGWFARLFRRPKPMAAIVYKLIKLAGGAGPAARYVEAIENGRFEGESLKAGLKRFKSLFRYQSENDTPERLAESFKRVQVRPPWFGGKPEERFRELRDLAKTYGTRDAGTVFKAASDAATAEEAAARREAWVSLNQLRNVDSKGAVYETVVTELGPHDPIETPIRVMAALCERISSGLALKAWETARGLAPDQPNVRARILDVLGSTRYTREMEALLERLKKAVGEESLDFRATLLSELVRTSEADRVLYIYDETTRVLGRRRLFEPLAGSYAGFLNLLSHSHRNASSLAEQTLAWLEKIHQDDPDGASVPDMFMELSGSLLLNPDLDGAKATLRAREEQRRKARRGQDKVAVEADEVTIGGIKVKVRKS
jgi:hypothetical protein